MKDISPILKALGLLDSETKLYLKALENGPGSVLDLAKATGLSRQAVYVAIESLTGRGLMSSALQGKKRFYAAEHPDRLMAYVKRHESEMKERVLELKRIIPELELQIAGERPSVRVFEGKEGLLSVIEDMRTIRAKSLVEITDMRAMNRVLKKEELEQLRRGLKRIGAKTDGIYAGMAPKAKTIVPGEKYVLPDNFKAFNSNIGVYEDKIVMVSFSGKIHSILIESQDLADSLKIVFELALARLNDLEKTIR